MADEFCLKMPDLHVTLRDLLHAVNLQHGTDGFTSPPKEGMLRIFFVLKNPTASVGFESASLGTKGQHATSRPPKPVSWRLLQAGFIQSSFLQLQSSDFIPDMDASKLRSPWVSVPSDKQALRWRTVAFFFPDFYFHVNWTLLLSFIHRNLSRSRVPHLIVALQSGYSSVQHSPIGPLVE